MSQATWKLLVAASPSLTKGTRYVLALLLYFIQLVNMVFKVAAMTKMNQDSTKWGGYQQYSTALAINTFSLGPKTSLQAAATLPVAVGTAFIGLYKVLGIPLPHSYSPHLLKDPATSHKSTSLVIYGASSSVGSFAVQLAKLSGLFVVGVAGKGADYPRTLGADAVVDYRGKSNTELVKEIELALGDTKLNYVCMCTY